MKRISASAGSAQTAGPGQRPAGRGAGQDGFILVFIMFLLVTCMIIGMAAMQTTVDETDISTNEVIVKQLYSLAESAVPLAARPLQVTAGMGSWATSCAEPCTAACTTPFYLDDDDPAVQATGIGVIEIVDGQFLFEGRDFDMAYDTRNNTWDKYLAAPNDTQHQGAYLPIDDPFGDPYAYGGSYDKLREAKQAVGVEVCPDMRIRAPNLTMDVDVDKVSVRYVRGGVAEFGSGADAGTGMAVKVSYTMDCLVTFPGRNLYDVNTPKTEHLITWGLQPTAGS